MAVTDRQKFITKLVGIVLQEPPAKETFDWFINKHTAEYFSNSYKIVHLIFEKLGGDIKENRNKRLQRLQADAFFNGNLNFLFEFDELQHFNSSRLLVLKMLPANIKVNYDLYEWITLCERHRRKADNYYRKKTARDFNFEGGRTAQRAYLDSFRDFLPAKHGLKPTLRINEFEVSDIFTDKKDDLKKLERVLKSKL